MQATVNIDRENWIGGSDIPTIMGISPFTSRYDLLLFKCGIKENDFKGNEFTEYGNIMEPKIRDYINNEYKRKFIETKYEYRATGFRCHLDGEDDNGVLEIKTTSQIHNNVDDYKIYLVQLLFYMINVGKKKGMLVVYERPSDFSQELDPNKIQVYEINSDDYLELIDDIMVEVDRFKDDINKLKENPLLTEEDLLPTVIQEISHDLDMLEHKIALYKDLEDEEKNLKEELYNQMVKYNIKKWKTPNGITITRVSDTEDKMIEKFNEDKFKEAQPTLYQRYCEPKLQKGKKGYVKITVPHE